MNKLTKNEMKFINNIADILADDNIEINKKVGQDADQDVPFITKLNEKRFVVKIESFKYSDDFDNFGLAVAHSDYHDEDRDIILPMLVVHDEEDKKMNGRIIELSFDHDNKEMHIQLLDDVKSTKKQPKVEEDDDDDDFSNPMGDNFEDFKFVGNVADEDDDDVKPKTKKPAPAPEPEEDEDDDDSDDSDDDSEEDKLPEITLADMRKALARKHIIVPKMGKVTDEGTEYALAIGGIDRKLFFKTLDSEMTRLGAKPFDEAGDRASYYEHAGGTYKVIFGKKAGVYFAKVIDLRKIDEDEFDDIEEQPVKPVKQPKVKENELVREVEKLAKMNTDQRKKLDEVVRELTKLKNAQKMFFEHLDKVADKAATLQKMLEE